MVFSILSYFTISKSYFIHYTISFYNIPNIPNLYFFPILFKYYFLILFLLFLFFYCFSSLSPQPLALALTSSKPILNKIKTSKSQQIQKSIPKSQQKIPPATPTKSQQKIHTKITQIKQANHNKSKSQTHYQTNPTNT